MERFFVDERTGCIAVRDRSNTRPEYQGLHSDTKGVVKYWSGIFTESGRLLIKELDREEAHILCNRLNKEEEIKELEKQLEELKGQLFVLVEELKKIKTDKGEFNEFYN